MNKKIPIGCVNKQIAKVYYDKHNVRYVGEVLEDEEYKFLLDGVKKKEDLVIVDIGCNIGTFSLYVYDIASVIYAIEPLKELIHTLDTTIRENKLDKIKTYTMAIGDSTGKGMFNIVEPKEAGASFLHHKGILEVDVMSLNDFCEKEKIKHIDLLKIDTEGGEREIVESTDFEKLPINCIIGEVHIGRVKQDTFYSLLSQKGYKIKEFGHKFIATKI